MFLICVFGFFLCGVILLDQMDLDQDDYFYINFIIVFGVFVFKFQEYNIVIEVFNLVMDINGIDFLFYSEIKMFFEFFVVVVKVNVGCVYFILR